MVVELQYDPKRKEVKIVSEYLNNIKERFSVKNPGARFNRYQRFLPQRIYAITNAGYCGIGLVPEIVDYLNSQTIPFEIKVNKEYNDVLLQTHILNTGTHKTLDSEFKLRDYQETAVNKALESGYGVVELATGGGKTLIIANLVYAALHSIKLTEKVLIVVPDLGLVAQTYKDFISYNFPMEIVSKWTGDTELDSNARVIIANMGILQSKNSDISWFSKVDLLVVDECLRKNTTLITPSGYKYIQDIKINDLVMSYNIETGCNEFQKVLNVWRNLYKSNAYDHFLEITTDDGNTIQVTPNHKIYTKKGMIRADALSINDEIICIKPSFFMKILNIKKIPRQNEDVFNIEVEHNNNYYANGILVSNCHKLRRGNKVCKLIDKIPTLRRIGFTGTLPENNIDKWNINNFIGPVIFKKTTTELRQDVGDKYIANAQVLALHIEYDFKPDYTSVSSSDMYRLELEYIHNKDFRYKVIQRVVKNLNNNCLILVDYIDHGLKMKEALDSLEGKQVFFIQGSMEVEDRKKIQTLMEKDDNIVCIAISKIFSTGISIKNIHYIIFAAGGKSKIKTLQSIGRGLRTHENKDILTIIDLVDELVYAFKHYEKRKDIYVKEQIPIQDKTIKETQS